MDKVKPSCRYLFWDTGFAADTIGPTRNDPDPGWTGCASAGPVGPDPAGHHPAARTAVTAGKMQARAKLEAEGKIPKERGKCLHEAMPWHRSMMKADDFSLQRKK